MNDLDMLQQIIPNLTIRKHLLEYLHVEDGRNWGVSSSKISRHHEKKWGIKTPDTRGTETYGKRNHLLAANIPTDGTLGEMNFSQSVIRRCALPTQVTRNVCLHSAVNTTWGVMMSRRNAFTWNSEHQSEQRGLNNTAPITRMLPVPAAVHRIQTLAWLHPPSLIETHNQ
jgi:hypothetical protein